MPDYKQLMLDRIGKRGEQLQSWIEKLKRQIEAGYLGGEPGRLWLEQFAVGKGLNIACGDFPIGESLGVDTDPEKIAIDFWGFGTHLGMAADSMDFVVTNYLECFPVVSQPLREWHRVLRTGGTLALVCCNSDKYVNPLGPLANHRRQNCFSAITLRWHLEREGFSVTHLELVDKEIRLAAKK